MKRIQGNILIKGTVEQRKSPRVSQMSPDKEKVINKSYAISECDLLLYCYNESATPNFEEVALANSETSMQFQRSRRNLL